MYVTNTASGIGARVGDCTAQIQGFDPSLCRLETVDRLGVHSCVTEILSATAGHNCANQDRVVKKTDIITIDED